MTRRGFQALLLCCAIGLAGCSTDPADGEIPQGPVVVRANLSSPPSSLSLIGKSDRYSEVIASQITDSLVIYDRNLQLVPHLAESWTVDRDSRSIQFTLRDGVRWHDGEPVTSHDVIFSVEIVRDPLTENRSFQPAFDDVESMQAIDDRTVRVTYGTLLPGALEGWRLPIVPRHLLEGQDLLTGTFQEAPIGCGPFRFVSREPGQRIELEANPDYWGGRPKIDRLVFRIFPDQRTAYQALLKGDLELSNLTPDLWRSINESDDADRFVSFIAPRMSVWVVAWNQDGSNPFFVDPRVRKAMVLALNREEFSQTIVRGAARPAVTTYSMLPRWKHPEIEPVPYDPEAAAQLLDAAGWTDRDGDGIRDKDGVPFRFTYIYHDSAQQLAHQMAAWQQQSWKALGIDAQLRTLEWGAFRQTRNAHRFEAAAYSLGMSPNPDQRNLYHSSFRENGFNVFGLNDPEIDRLTTQAQVEFDEERRTELYRALQERLAELEPLSALFQFSSPVVHDRRLQGLVPAPVDHWRIQEGPAVWWWDPGA